MGARGRIRIGTSGWSYRHWVGPFYPEGTPAKGYLDHYIQHFATTELNNTFYSLPKPKTLAGWRDAVPEDFDFACKASRYITHMKKLKDPADSTKRFFETVDVLGDKLGPILFQLPPSWGVDLERLGSFLAALPGGRRYTFEFRDESWLTPAVYDLLSKHDAALCIYHLEGFLSPKEVTAGFVYVRLHGPEEEAYRGSYGDAALAGWARRLAEWSGAGRDVYCYFDNDEAGYAPNDALRLLRAVEREGRSA